MAVKKKEPGIVVMYHADCPDGFGGAYAAWKKFGRKAEYIAVHHSDKALKMKGKHVYFIDIIYKKESFLRLKRHNTITALDHHVSARAEIEASDNFRYALERSGAVLAWKYFHPGKKVPLFLQHIEDRDLWKFKLNGTQEFMAHLGLFPYEFRTWDALIGNFNKPVFRKQFLKTGALLLAFEKNLIAQILPYATLVEFQGHKVYAINAPHMWSDEVGHALYGKKPPFAIIWRVQGDLVKASMRGTGKVDLTKIAGKFGGGGHRGSAGFSFKLSEGFPWRTINK